MSLFHQGIHVVALGSGSKGNCTWIGDARRGVLIDCGISTRQVFARLEAAGLADARIDGVLITHEHSDHVAAAAILDRRLEKLTGERIPFFLTAGTLRNLPAKRRPRRVEVVRAGVPVALHGWTLEPHAIPHDVPEPIAWTVQADGVRVGVITDLGHGPRLVRHLLGQLDVAVLEFNHDTTMLLDGPYPWPLKQRIRSNHGHLSNDQAADLLERGASNRLKHLVLAHLSEENNTPEAALQAAESALHRAGLSGVAIQIGHPRVPTDPVRMSPRIHAVASPGAPRRRARPSEAATAPSGQQPSLFGGLSPAEGLS